MFPGDWEKIEREFEVRDSQGRVVYGNKKLACAPIGSFLGCEFELSPENPRMGLLLKQGSYGLMTYRSQWFAV